MSTFSYITFIITIGCIFQKLFIAADTSSPPQTFCQEQFGKCYIIPSTDPQTWLDAETLCIGSGRNGHLTSILSAFENSLVFGRRSNWVWSTFIVADIKSNVTSAGDYWIGATRSNVSDRFLWSDNKIFDYNRWGTGFPSSISSDLCVGVYVQPESVQATWYNTDCNSQKVAVCEIDLNDVVMCPTGWIYYSFTNACYLTVEQSNTTWMAAQNLCRQNGNANLTSIHSFEENEFIAKLAYNSSITSAADIDQTWIGLYSPWQNATFAWIDNTPFDYSHWHSGEPSSSNNNNEHCVELYSNLNPNWGGDPVTWYGRWNDIGCSNAMRSFVCKQSANNMQMQ